MDGRYVLPDGHPIQQSRDDGGCAENARQSKAFRDEAKSIGDRINKWCWNEEDGFYYDVQSDGTQYKVKTLGGFWPLLAGIASKEQAERLVTHLKAIASLPPFVFPSLAADEPQYQPTATTGAAGVGADQFMVIKGLESYGYEDFAIEATEKYLARCTRPSKTPARSGRTTHLKR